MAVLVITYCLSLLSLLSKGEDDLSYLLNAREALAVMKLDAAFVERFQSDPNETDDLVYFLGDNPDYCHTWSAISQRVPCFRMNNGLMWFPKFKRFMTAVDKLTAVGMPVCPKYAEALAVHPIGVRDPHRADMLSGNMMSLSSVTIMQLVALSSFGKKQL